MRSATENHAVCGQVTGIILAGGQSRRMGRNKALLDIGGKPLIERTFQTLSALFGEVLVVTNTPEDYAFLPCPRVRDIYPQVGSIAGLHTGLQVSSTDRAFVVPCDMPFLSPALMTQMCAHAGDYDACVPISGQGIEPLHALYRRSCIDQLEAGIKSGRKSLLAFLQHVRVKYLSVFDCQDRADSARLFCNLNYPQDYQTLYPRQTVTL